MSELILTGCLLFLAGVVLGYLLGRLDLLVSAVSKQQSNNEPQGFFSKNNKKPPGPGPSNIQIDDRKVVAASQISTDSLQNISGATLGKSTTKKDDINSSVSKLAQLKGK